MGVFQAVDAVSWLQLHCILQVSVMAWVILSAWWRYKACASPLLGS
jgi:hypothetical protein